MSPLPPADGQSSTREVARVRLPRLLILDTQRLFAEALRHTLVEVSLLVVDVATKATAALSAVRDGHPEVVVASTTFMRESGVGVLREILDGSPETRVIVLVEEGEPFPRAETGIDFHGFVSKALPAAGFVEAIEGTLRGRIPPPPRADTVPTKPPGPEGWMVRLTAREQEVLYLLASGSTSDEIAARFGVQANTARKHVQNILTKLQVHSRLEAVTVAMRKGIVRLEDVDGGGESPEQRSDARLVRLTNMH